MRIRCDSWAPVLKLLGHAGTVLADTISYSIGTFQESIESFMFAFAYPEPELIKDVDSPSTDPTCMKLYYRIGQQRFSVFYNALKSPSRSRIVGARIFRPEASIQVKSVVQELAGPYDDFMGMKITGNDILRHFVHEDDLSGFTRSNWESNSQFEITLLDGTNDNGNPKLTNKFLPMNEPI